MNHVSRFLCLILISLGLIASCSSSSITPAESEAALGISSPNDITTEPGTEPVNTDASGAAPGGTIGLNGDYSVAVLLSEESLAVPECEAVMGVMNVTGTTITGIVDDRLIISGTIASDGTISGGFAFDGDSSPFATYDGLLDGGELAGEWQDVTGCAGTWRAVRINRGENQPG